MIAIRPLHAGDRDPFQAFVRGLSGESRVNRFLAPIQELGPGALNALTQPDQQRHLGLVAVEGDRIIGEGRVVALGTGGRAEFALAVADAWQRQGLGTRILGVLIAAATRAGIAMLEGEVLRTNVAMLNLLCRAGFRLRAVPGDARLTLAERELHGT